MIRLKRADLWQRNRFAGIRPFLRVESTISIAKKVLQITHPRFTACFKREITHLLCGKSLIALLLKSLSVAAGPLKVPTEGISGRGQF